MAFAVKGNDPQRTETIAVSITEAVPIKNLPGGDCTEFIIQEFSKIMRNSSELFKITVDIRNDYLFEIYTYADPISIFLSGRENKIDQDQIKPLLLETLAALDSITWQETQLGTREEASFRAKVKRDLRKFIKETEDGERQ